MYSLILAFYAAEQRGIDPQRLKLSNKSYMKDFRFCYLIWNRLLLLGFGQRAILAEETI